jgi:hypothetical protein
MITDSKVRTRILRPDSYRVKNDYWPSIVVYNYSRLNNENISGEIR